MSAAARLAVRPSVRLLVVSPEEQDHSSLQSILGPGCELHRAAGRQDAESLVMRTRPQIVICAQAFADGDWRDLLADLQNQPDAPSLIVSSRLADDRLWAEVLNLGGCDVLTKPFTDIEVMHSVRMAAWRQTIKGGTAKA